MVMNFQHLYHEVKIVSLNIQRLRVGKSDMSVSKKQTKDSPKAKQLDVYS